jgi:hypothetical protein
MRAGGTRSSAQQPQRWWRRLMLATGIAVAMLLGIAMWRSSSANRPGQEGDGASSGVSQLDPDHRDAAALAVVSGHHRGGTPSPVIHGGGGAKMQRHRAVGHHGWARAAMLSRHSTLLLRLEGGDPAAASLLPPEVRITLDPKRARRHYRWIRRQLFRARMASANASSPNDRICTPGSGDCQFYRSEAVPPLERPEGPPYGLLQGRMRGLLPSTASEADALKHEVTPGGTIRPGDVVRIQGADFFIALVSHDSWAASFTVFGRVESASQLEALIAYADRAAFHVQAHSSGTKMRLLDTAVSFTIGVAGSVADDVPKNVTSF